MRLFLFIISSIFSLSITISAQGNMQFSQVKIVTAQETVPVGKIWKVESVIYNVPENQSGFQSSNYNASCNISYYRSTAITINGIFTKAGNVTEPASYSSGDYTHSYTKLPLWLPAGSTLSGGPCLNQISILEFNIVP